MSDTANRQRRRDTALLHQLRSSLARAQAEAEILGLDGVFVTPLVDALGQALIQLSLLEDSLCGLPVNLPKLRAIVVDDDARLAELTAARLLKRGIDAAHSHALSAALNGSDGVVLVIDLSVLLGASDEDRSSLRARPFVVVSGENSADARGRAIALGAADYFLKPVRIDELTSRLGAILAGQT